MRWGFGFTHPCTFGCAIFHLQGVIMTSNIIEFTNKHLNVRVDVTFEQRFFSPSLKPCTGHFFGGVARHRGGLIVQNDSTGHWGSFITDEWESWEDDNGECSCGMGPVRLGCKPIRVMFDILDDRWPITEISRSGAIMTAWNTHVEYRGQQTEKVRIELLDALELPRW
jgi:hypothetical protein